MNKEKLLQSIKNAHKVINAAEGTDFSHYILTKAVQPLLVSHFQNHASLEKCFNDCEFTEGSNELRGGIIFYGKEQMLYIPDKPVIWRPVCYVNYSHNELFDEKRVIILKTLGEDMLSLKAEIDKYYSELITQNNIFVTEEKETGFVPENFKEALKDMEDLTRYYKNKA